MQATIIRYKWNLNNSFSDECRVTHGVQGSCKESVPSWTYNPTAKKCEEFTYSGCGGNENRFSDVQECDVRCIKNYSPTRKNFKNRLSSV